MTIVRFLRSPKKWRNAKEFLINNLQPWYMRSPFYLKGAVKISFGSDTVFPTPDY